MKNWKKHPKKFLRIGLDPFFPRSSPGISPQPKIDFPYYKISGPDICSLIWAISLCFIVHCFTYEKCICIWVGQFELSIRCVLIFWDQKFPNIATSNIVAIATCHWEKEMSYCYQCKEHAEIDKVWHVIECSLLNGGQWSSVWF